jgi:hypothetical protein
MEIQVTDAREIAAVKAGEIEGCVYRDDQECWADVQSLLAWRDSHGINNAT